MLVCLLFLMTNDYFICLDLQLLSDNMGELNMTSQDALNALSEDPTAELYPAVVECFIVILLG